MKQRPPPAWVDELQAISFDFGNTLVRIRREDLRLVVERMATELSERSGPFDERAFAIVWREEGERQFAEDVPRLREVDLAQRTARVLARMRGMAAPDRSTPWDDAAAAGRSAPEEVAFALEAYSRAFVATIQPPPEVVGLLDRLAARFVLGIASNWPLAAIIDRFVGSVGWAPYLRAVVVSERVGSIKPDPRFFRSAEVAFGVGAGSILHVGDDWAADVVGARRAGWRVAYLDVRQPDSPFPDSAPDDGVEPDIRLERLMDLEAALGSRPG